MAKKKDGGEVKVSEEAKESKKSRFNFSKLNYWMVASVLLVVLLLVIVSFNSFTTISKKSAGEKAVELANISGLELTVLSVENKGSFYSVNYSIQGQQGVIDVSKDGKYIGQMTAFPEIDNSEPTTDTSTIIEVPKSDKPEVELYTWGYCPFGVQAQGPMAQVATLLKASADFEIVPFHDGHGAYETQQNKIQLCIQKLAKDKYWAYAAKFVSDVYPKCSSARTEECDKTESIIAMKAVGIDSTKVMSCVSTEGAALFTAAKAKAQQAGVGGSPTTIINGQTIGGNSCNSNSDCNAGESCANDGSGGKACMLGRDANSMKLSVCAAFNDAPAVCSTALDSSAAASAGNC